MKILLLIDSLGSGGAQRQIITLAALLKQQGQEVSFLLYADEGFFQNEVEKLNIPIHLIRTKSYLQRIWQVRKYIRNGKYDAVISFMDTPNFLNNFAAIGGKNWKVITSERSSKEDYLFTKQGRIFGWFQHYSDAIVCNSHNAMAMWENHYPKYKNKLSVIYNPVLLPEITSTYIPKKDGKLNVVIAASYQYLKNPIGLVKAIALMSEEERSKLVVNWYGRIEPVPNDSKAYNATKELIELNHLQHTVMLYEATKDIGNKMKEADVVALFSELEGLPNVICEGMMLGKPIIMSRVSDYNNLVDEHNGFLCDWDSPESIKDALVGALNLSNDEITQMGKASKIKAEKMFSKETIVMRWIKLIRN